MNDPQLVAPDGSWFLFADWQGMTRIALPGDKPKTDSNLDRPHEDKPLVLRPNGLVWSTYACDVDPGTLKKVRPANPGHHSPDPLGGSELVVGYSGEAVTVRDDVLAFATRGDALPLGGVPGRREEWAPMAYDVHADGAVFVFGWAKEQLHAGLIVRSDGGGGRIAWCRPVARVQNGSPEAFRHGGTTWLCDRDIEENVAYLVEVRDDGTVASEQRCTAVAGPWVHDARLWWQPDDRTLCAGAQLGRPEASFAFSDAHAGPGRLLRLPGRTLYLPWHGATILDLAPSRKGRDEISRKHKAADAPMYHEAARMLRPITAGMAKRGIRVSWRGVNRRGKKSIAPVVEIRGSSDVITYLLAGALQNGAQARLASTGVIWVSCIGGNALDAIFASRAPTTADDIGDLVAMLDAAGISRASGIPSLVSLAESGRQRGCSLPLADGAEQVALAATLSGLRGESSGTPAPVTLASLAEAAPILGDHEALRKAGIDGPSAAMFVTVAGTRRFGAAAVAPVRDVLLRMNPVYAGNVEQALSRPTSGSA